MKTNLVLQNLDLSEFVNLNLKCLHFFGYFFPKHESSRTKILYRLYAWTFVISIFILGLLSQTGKMIESFGDIETMTDASFLLLTSLMQCIKIYSFNIYREEIWALVSGMNRQNFKPKNLEQVQILKEEIKMSKQITKLFFLMCTLACTSWAFSPLFDKKSEDGLNLPLSGWYPFSTNQSPVFEFVYVYQVLVAWLGGLGNISMDTFMSGSVMVISAQLSVLNNAVEDMKRTYYRNRLINRSESLDNMNKILIECVIHYKNILEFADDFTIIFTYNLTGMFVVAVLIMCVSMFQMSLVPAVSFRFLAMFLYQICILMEIYLWCYYGNEVILKSDQLTKSAYMCEWTDAPPEFKQNLLIFMTRTQFPLKLYASGYFTLSLETFKAIVKSSWSYFAVLNQVHSTED